MAAYGQNTTLKGVRECDLAIAIQGKVIMSYPPEALCGEDLC